MDELETTLRIRPALDTAAAQQIGDQIAQQVNASIGAGIGRGIASGPGASTASTAASTATWQTPGATPSGSGPGGSPTGWSTTSTSGGGGGGTPSGGGGGPSGGPGGSLWTGEQINDMGRVNRVRPDMSQYLSGSGLSSTARFLGSIAGNAPMQAVSAVTTGIGDALNGAARERAQQIEDAKAMGLPVPSMGMLRYAGPIGTAISVAGSFIAGKVDEGLSLQEQTSLRYAGMGQRLARAFSSGTINPGFMSIAARADRGGYGPEQALGIADTLGGVGMRQNPYNYDRALELGMTGVGFDALAGYQQARRYGNRTTTLGAAEGAIGAGQAYGLTGPGLDALLGQIAQNTASMARRGVRIDATEINTLLNRAVNNGISPEVAAQGMGQMQGNVVGLRDQALAPFKAYGDALVQMRALQGARSYEDYARNLEGLAASPRGILDAIRPGGALVGTAYQGTGFANDLSQARVLPGEDVTKPIQVMGRDGVARQAVNQAFGFASVAATTESQRLANVQNLGSFEAQQDFKRDSERRAMNIGSGFNETKDAIIEAMHRGMIPTVDAINELIREIRTERNPVRELNGWRRP